MIPSHDPVAVLATFVEFADLPLHERLRLFDWLLEEHPGAILNADVRGVAESLLKQARWYRLPTAVCAEEPNADGDHRLECADCGGRSGSGAISWRAYLGTDDQIFTFCPGCAEREFDQAP
jgi:hypothetical protein